MISIKKISEHLHSLSGGLDTCISQYDDIMILKDHNVESFDPVLNDFCNVYNLFSLVKEPTCFKNLYNPSCIDIFLTNRPWSFQSTVTIGTYISDFRKMVIWFWKFSTKNKNQTSFNTGAIRTLIIRYFRENWILNNWTLI